MRRLRGDLIEVFKILKGYDDIGKDIFFVRSKSRLRGHQLKLQKKSVRLDIVKYSSSNRVVNEWNNLSKEVVASKSLAIKKKLDFHLHNNGIYTNFELLSRLSSCNKFFLSLYLHVGNPTASN